MKIRINKIHGKYNIELDLSKKNNILIGENGIGKSTAIKIFNYLFTFKYIKLLNYYFESIEVISEEEQLLINYNDILINKDYLLIKYLKNDYEKYIEIKKAINKNQSNHNKKHEISINYFESKMIENFDPYYIEFITFVNELDNRLMYKILKNKIELFRNEKKLKYYYDLGLLEDFMKYINDIYKDDIIYNSDKTYYNHSNINAIHSKLKNIFSTINYDDVLFLDLSSNYDIINDFNIKYTYNKFEDEIKKQNPLKLLDTKILSIQEKYPKYFEPNNYNIFLQNLGYKLDKVKINNTIDLGKFLFNKIYNKEKLEMFSHDLYETIFNNINYSIEENLEYKITEDIFSKLQLYLKPLIPKNNILDNKLNEYTNNFSSDKEYSLLCEFLKKYKDKYIDLTDSRLDKLNFLLKKYIRNKNVIATPFGISISTQNYENDINFEELSAGERKIIILFTVTVFSDNLIILLDEPETSLSPVWQKNILMDINNNSNLSKLIVATQSPYLISNNELLEFLVFLPEENKNV